MIIEIVYLNVRDQNGRFVQCKCENAVRTRGWGRQAEVESKCCFFTRSVSESPVWIHVWNYIFLYKCMRYLSGLTVYRHRKCAVIQPHLIPVNTTRRCTASIKPRGLCLEHLTLYASCNVYKNDSQRSYRLLATLAAGIRLSRSLSS